MPGLTTHNLSDEARRALETRADRGGCGARMEIQADPESVTRPEQPILLGTELAAIGRLIGGVDLDIERDRIPSAPVSFD